MEDFLVLVISYFVSLCFLFFLLFFDFISALFFVALTGCFPLLFALACHTCIYDAHNVLIISSDHKKLVGVAQTQATSI